ncbi:MAG: hypothetical protein KC609_23900 [Myxococcales bacterium]|nr:hypothetical protein [Myxococcales bacterium]
MTSTHMFYIPVLLLVGFIIGYIVGRQVLLAQLEEADQHLDAAHHDHHDDDRRDDARRDGSTKAPHSNP